MSGVAEGNVRHCVSCCCGYGIKTLTLAAVCPTQPAYLGEVTLLVECELTDNRGNSLAEPIRPLQFTVLPVVAVRSSAYKIGSHVISVASAPAQAILSHDRPAR